MKVNWFMVVMWVIYIPLMIPIGVLTGALKGGWDVLLRCGRECDVVSPPLDTSANSGEAGSVMNSVQTTKIKQLESDESDPMSEIYILMRELNCDG